MVTASKAPDMSKDKTDATCFLELQTVWICSKSNSRAASVDLFFQFPIWFLKASCAALLGC